MEDRTDIQAIILELLELSIAEPIVAREKADEIIWDAIRFFGKQIEVAQKVESSKQTFNYRANHAKKVAIEAIYQILKLLHPEDIKTQKANYFIARLPRSQRMKIGNARLVQERKKAGRKPKQNTAQEALICQNFGRLKGKPPRLGDEIAKRCVN